MLMIKNGLRTFQNVISFPVSIQNTNAVQAQEKRDSLLQ